MEFRSSLFVSLTRLLVDHFLHMGVAAGSLSNDLVLVWPLEWKFFCFRGSAFGNRFLFCWRYDRFILPDAQEVSSHAACFRTQTAS
jgi:hypothetical protein